LVDDISAYLCEETYDKYAGTKNDVLRRDLRLKKMKSKFNKNYIKKNLSMLKSKESIYDSPILNVSFFFGIWVGCECGYA
jgi:hypothetical protein